jgi:hypothetical protein
VSETTKKALRAWARRQARLLAAELLEAEVGRLRESARLSEHPEDAALALEGERLRQALVTMAPISALEE